MSNHYILIEFDEHSGRKPDYPPHTIGEFDCTDDQLCVRLANFLVNGDDYHYDRTSIIVKLLSYANRLDKFTEQQISDAYDNPDEHFLPVTTEEIAAIVEELTTGEPTRIPSLLSSMNFGSGSILLMRDNDRIWPQIYDRLGWNE